MRLTLTIFSIFISLITFAQTPITGTTSTCVGLYTRLANATSGGTWSSSTTAVATITKFGDVLGVSVGTATITYTTTGTPATTTVTINPSIGTISGFGSLCPGTTLTLSNTVTGGIWSSSNSTVATIGSTSGILNTITGGTTNVTYSLNGCSNVQSVVVNYSPGIIGCNNAGVGDTFYFNTGGGYMPQC